MERVENGSLFHTLVQVTNRLVFRVAEAQPFKRCEKYFPGAMTSLTSVKAPIGGYYRPIHKTRTGKSPSGAHHP